VYLRVVPLLRRALPKQPSWSGIERANLFVLILLGLQRVSYLVPPLVSHGGGYASPRLNAGLLAGTVAWNVGLFTAARRRGWVEPWMVWVDVAWACALAVLVANNLPADQYDGPLNWSSRTSQAAAGLAGSAVGPLGLTVLAVGALLATHAGVTVASLAGSGDLVPELVGCLNGLLWFAVILGFAVRYLRRQGRALDEAVARRVAAETRQAAERGRFAARLAHHRALHDTVLSTLTVIARGGLAEGGSRVRRRAARDAELIRRMLTEDDAQGGGGLGPVLDEAATAAEDLGLRVRCGYHDLPDDLPPDVVEAVGAASREALNNVAAHAGVAEAWLTATWADDALTVRVVDRGRGFPADPRRYGFGLRSSVSDRMRSVGGTARISSGEQEGTCVELRWSRQRQGARS